MFASSESSGDKFEFAQSHATFHEEFFSQKKSVTVTEVGTGKVTEEGTCQANEVE